jgi:hypothetical protein
MKTVGCYVRCDLSRCGSRPAPGDRIGLHLRLARAEFPIVDHAVVGSQEVQEPLVILLLNTKELKESPITA